MIRYLFIAFIFPFIVRSQDTLYLRSGDVKAAKITEVGVKEIKYQRYNMADGPVYILNRNDVLKIKYTTGHIDSFKVETPRVTELHSAPDKLIIDGYHFHFPNQKNLNWKQLLETANEKSARLNLPDLRYIAKTARREHRLEKIFLPIGIPCLAIGAGSLFGGLATLSLGDNTGFTITTVGAAFLVSGISFTTMSGVFHKKFRRDIIKTAELYNKY